MRSEPVWWCVCVCDSAVEVTLGAPELFPAFLWLDPGPGARDLAAQGGAVSASTCHRITKTR